MPDLKWSTSLQAFSPKMQAMRWFNNLASLPNMANVDMFSEVNSSFVKSLLFELMEPDLRKHFPSELVQDLSAKVLERFDIQDIDTIHNGFRRSLKREQEQLDQGTRTAIYHRFQADSFQGSLLAMFSQLRLFYPVETVKSHVDSLQRVKVDSQTSFNERANSLLKALTWMPEGYTARSLYSACKKSLPESMIVAHNKHDRDNQTNLRKKEPRYDSFDSDRQDDVDWQDLRDLFAFIQSEYLMAATGGILSKSSTARSTVALVSDSSVAPSEGAQVMVATLETIEAQLKSPERSLAEKNQVLTKQQADLSQKVDKVTQQLATVIDSQQLRPGSVRPEIGSQRPLTPSLPVTGAASPSPSRQSFNDAREISSPSTRSGPDRSVSFARQGARSPSASSTASGGGGRLENQPANACWKYLKGDCPRGDSCKFVHWLPSDQRSVTSLRAAAVSVSDFEEQWHGNALPLDDFREAVNGVVLGCPVLLPYVESMFEQSGDNDNIGFE
jgi:hypothetical protein